MVTYDKCYIIEEIRLLFLSAGGSKASSDARFSHKFWRRNHFHFDAFRLMVNKVKLVAEKMEDGMFQFLTYPMFVSENPDDDRIASRSQVLILRTLKWWAKRLPAPRTWPVRPLRG